MREGGAGKGVAGRGGGGGSGGGEDEEPMKRGWENKKGTVVLFPGRVKYKNLVLSNETIRASAGYVSL